MDTRAVIVAVLFGALAGWGLGWRNPDPRPIALAFALGMVMGVIAVVLEIGSSMAGWSLLLGCPAALAGLTPWLRRKRAGSQPSGG